jgi:GAF domain-containing protein
MAKKSDMRKTKAQLVEELQELRQQVATLREPKEEHERAAADREKLLVDLRHLKSQLQTASEVSRAASSILDPNELIQQFVDLARERFELYYAGLFLVDEDGEWAVLRAGTGEAGQEMIAQDHRLEVGGDSMIGQCVATSQARIALDVGEEAARFDNPLLPETRAEMALPLISRGRTLGALTIQSAQEAAFSREETAVLQTMADQLANAIDNARLFDQVQVRAEELATLNLIASTVSRSLETQDLLEAALEATIEALGYDAGLISLYDEDADRLYLGSHRGLPAPMVAKFEQDGLADTLCDVVYQTGEALGIGDLREGAPVDVSGLVNNDLLAYVGSPIAFQDEVLGTFCLFSRSVQDAAAAKLSLLDAIGQQIGIGVQNARLFDQTQAALTKTQDQAHRLALLGEMSERLSRAVDFEEIMAVSANSVSRVFGADRASVAMLTATGDSFEIFALRGAEGESPVGTRMQAAGSEMEVAVRERRLIIHSGEPRPDLGGISSFMVAPLLTAGQAIGTLNVASKQPHAYTRDDGNLLLQAAAFISSAIENRRLFEETQSALEEVEATHRRYLEQEWKDYVQTVRTTSHETGHPDAPSLGDTVLPEIRQATEQQGAVVLTSNGTEGESRSALVAPVALRGTVIGALGIHGAEGRQWTDDEIALIEGIAERLALAAENLRLLDDAQRRATREQLTREITDKMRNAADMDALLQTSIQEIAAALGASSSFVQLGTLPDLGGDARKGTDFLSRGVVDAASDDESLPGE